jgi:hypothetical protein
MIAGFHQRARSSWPSKKHRVVLASLALAVPTASSSSGAASSVTRTLPLTGLAVETARGVSLLDLGGRVRRRLPGLRLRDIGLEPQGRVVLVDRRRRAYEIAGGSLVRVPADTVLLPGGYALRFDERWELRRGRRVVERIRRGTHLELDASGSLLSLVPATSDGSSTGSTRVRELLSGKTTALARGCRVGARGGGVTFELCGYPYVKRQPSTIVGADADGRRTLVGPALRGAHGPAGYWAAVALAPGGKTLLAQWSGECEVPLAYAVDVGRRRLSLLSRDAAGRPVEGVALGWNRTTALVAMSASPCAESTPRPGIYAFSGGRAALVYPLARASISAVRLWK